MGFYTNSKWSLSVNYWNRQNLKKFILSLDENLKGQLPVLKSHGK